MVRGLAHPFHRTVHPRALTLESTVDTEWALEACLPSPTALGMEP